MRSVGAPACWRSRAARLVEPQALAGGDAAEDRGAQQRMLEAQCGVEEPGEHERVRGGARRRWSEPATSAAKASVAASPTVASERASAVAAGPSRRSRADTDRATLAGLTAATAAPRSRVGTHAVGAQRPEQVDEQERVAARGGEARGHERVVQRLAEPRGDERSTESCPSPRSRSVTVSGWANSGASSGSPAVGRVPIAIRAGTESSRSWRNPRNRSVDSSAQCTSSSARTSGLRFARPDRSQNRPLSTA